MSSSVPGYFIKVLHKLRQEDLKLFTFCEFLNPENEREAWPYSL